MKRRSINNKKEMEVLFACHGAIGEMECEDDREKE